MIQSLEHHELINGEVVEELIKAAEINKDDIVLEIGAGKGIITKELCEKANEVIAVEKDEKCVEVLEKMNLSNLLIISGDFLEVKLPSWNKLVANPPFNILEPLMYYLSGQIFDCVVLIAGENFVKELIDNGETRISIFSKAYFKAELISELSKTDFLPPPRTKTCIIKITRKDKMDLNQKELFLREFFDQKDKTIKNSFAESCTRVFKLTKRQAKEKFDKLQIKETDRRVLLVSNEELGEIIKTLNE